MEEVELVEDKIFPSPENPKENIKQWIIIDKSGWIIAEVEVF